MYHSVKPEPAAQEQRSWDALLRREYPHRAFQVETYDDEWHGARVTFFSTPSADSPR